MFTLQDIGTNPYAHGLRRKPVASLRDNVEAYDRYKIWPRVFRNVSEVDTAGKLMGYTVWCATIPSHPGIEC